MRKSALVVALIAALAVGGSGSAAPGPIPEASGCQRVPSSGTLPPNQSASTTLEYSNYWQWSNASATQSFDWSIRKTDGTSVASGSSGGSGNSRSLPANDYLFRVVNRGAVGQYWNVCYDVL